MILASCPLPRPRRAYPVIKFARVLLGVMLAAAAPAAVTPLFDGATLAGWEGAPGVWRVQDGCIVGGSLAGNPRNEFLASRATWRNFILRLEYRLVGSEGFVNSGVQLRSQRIAVPANEMSGFQADIGAGYSGCLYDESRRRRVLAAAPKEVVAAAERPGEWNRYEVRCEGARIRILLNDRLTVDYVEHEAGIAEDGHIALQIHGDGKSEVAFRAITLEELPADLVPSPGEILGRFADGAPPAAPAPASAWQDGRFTLASGETVVFVGQENMVRTQRDGALEAQLAGAYAAAAPRFRFMAWEGDTVYEQWRDLNFGNWAGQLDAVGATVVVAQFGQLEAFDGVARLPAFTAAYHHLLDQLGGHARLVLLSPLPFEGGAGAHLPDLTRRNADTAAYALAVQAISGQRGALYVDLMTPLARRAADAPRLTDDGLHLNATGLAEVARLVCDRLGAAPSPAAADPALRDAISDKNRLFADCWRPANWSFVYGDRVQWPFAKPSGDQPALRSLFERLRPLVAERDAAIHALAAGRAPPAPAAPPAAAPTAPEAPFPTPEEELAACTVAAGFTMTLVASERDGVVKPTQIAWDERGRLYIACSPTYPHVRPGVRPQDFVLACDGIGGAALRTWRYAEGLTMVEGLEPGDGGLYVCDYDQLVHIADHDAGGGPGARRVVLSGFGIGDTHQLINSLTHGPDGSLWFTQGLHAFSRVETPWGVERLDKAGVWRLRPRTLRLEGYFAGAKAGANCWGVAFDDHRQPFHKSGDRPEGYWSLPGLVHLADPDDYHPIGGLFRTPAKTTSLDFIGSSAMPDDLQGCAVLAGFFANSIDLHRLRDDGAGFASQELPKLVRSSNDVFRPVDVSLGPDGAIYVADWCNPVIGHYQASYADAHRDHGHGRIWRIAAKGRTAPARPDLGAATPAQLLGLLAAPERWTRAQAQRLLGDLPDAAVLPVADAWAAGIDAATPGGEEQLASALDVFAAHEAPRPALLARALAAQSAPVRAYAVRIAGDWAAQLPDPLAALRAGIGDAQPRVRLEAIVACSRVPSAAAAAVAVRALAAPHDRFTDYALAQTVRALKPQWAPALASGDLAVTDPDQLALLRRAAGALPEVPHPGRVIFESLCLNCHQADGRGLAGIYPPLAGSEWVAGPTRPLARVLLHGLSGRISVAGGTFGVQVPLPMPPMGLSDQQMADVLTYVRGAFGNQAGAVTVEEIAAERAASAAHRGPWTAEELVPTPPQP